jgi:LemA protein
MPYIIGGIVLFVAFVIVSWCIRTSNGFKRSIVKIDEALSGIEIALTKRYDTLTKLLDVTKGYAAHEKELFTQVIELRRGMSLAQMSAANGQLDTLNARINAVAENYPELRSAEVFRELQAGIRDAEQHLQAARRLYNSNVSSFNQSIAVFPASIIANQARHTPKEFFEAEESKLADVKMSL